MRHLRLTTLTLAGLTALGAAIVAADEPLEFTDIFGDPIDIGTPRSGETFTAAVEQFHMTGENPYGGDADAIAAGQRIYRQACQACHLPDGSGRMGPSLIDDNYKHERTATDKGFFEIVYGGAAGAMQAFGNRYDQDQILQVMAYIETLRPD